MLENEFYMYIIAPKIRMRTWKRAISLGHGQEPIARQERTLFHPTYVQIGHQKKSAYRLTCEMGTERNFFLPLR